MKIIKKGRKQSGWSKEFACTGSGNGGGGCGAVLLVSEGDLYHTHHSHYWGETSVYTTFTCPCCKVKTDVSNIPSSVKIFEDEATYKKSKSSSRSGLSEM